MVYFQLAAWIIIIEIRFNLTQSSNLIIDRRSVA